MDENGVSRGVGFVRFDKRRQAELSIESLNNKVPNLTGSVKPLTVKFANPPSQKVQSYVDILAQAKAGIASAGYLNTQGMYSPLSAAAVMASNSPGGATSNGCNGSSTSPTSFMNSSSGSSSGFSSANNILNNLSAQSSSAAAAAGVTSWCVFVYNLPSDANDLTLFQLFSKHGAIHSVRVIIDHEKKCRGYGFVNMVHYEDALAGIFRLNGYCLERGKPLQVSLKRPKTMSMS